MQFRFTLVIILMFLVIQASPSHLLEGSLHVLNLTSITYLYKPRAQYGNTQVSCSSDKLPIPSLFRTKGTFEQQQSGKREWQYSSAESLYRRPAFLYCMKDSGTVQWARPIRIKAKAGNRSAASSSCLIVSLALRAKWAHWTLSGRKQVRPRGCKTTPLYPPLWRTQQK